MRWNAAIVEMDRSINYLYHMGIEMFCNFVKIHSWLHFLEPIYGDETKMRRVNLVVEIFVLFFLSLLLLHNNLYLLTKKTIHFIKF
jgi:hypothetical protein